MGFLLFSSEFFGNYFVTYILKENGSFLKMHFFLWEHTRLNIILFGKMMSISAEPVALC